jgi:hypothetical protein
MRDILKDLVTHTYALKCVEFVKVTGSEDETKIETVATDKSLIIIGHTKEPCIDLTGTVGMQELNKLNLLLDNPEYRENAKIEVAWEIRGGKNQPVAINFTNKDGDCSNKYSLMRAEFIDEKIKKMEFNGASWHAEFQPSLSSISRLKLQSAIHNEEDFFVVKSDKSDLKIFFGNAGTHEGNFVFHKNITGALKKSWSYPVTRFLSILNLDGEKTIKFSDMGLAMITIDTGLSVYNYYIPASV